MLKGMGGCICLCCYVDVCLSLRDTSGEYDEEWWFRAGAGWLVMDQKTGSGVGGISPWQTHLSGLPRNVLI